jgi:hypothetical protein
MSEVKHTPGPWRWALNESSKTLCLVGGKPMYDLTIISPERWGTGSATFSLRDTAHDGMNIMHKIHERRDWIAPFKGREHHATWCANVVHPDMCLIAAAPDLLVALDQLVQYVVDKAPADHMEGALKTAERALAKAQGAQP